MSLAAFGAAPSEVVEREPAFSAKTFLDTLHKSTTPNMCARGF
jgi:hypothetical protein